MVSIIPRLRASAYSRIRPRGKTTSNSVSSAIDAEPANHVLNPVISSSAFGESDPPSDLAIPHPCLCGLASQKGASLPAEATSACVIP